MKELIKYKTKRSKLNSFASLHCLTPANLPQPVLNLAQLPCMTDHTFPSSPTSSNLHGAQEDQL